MQKKPTSQKAASAPRAGHSVSASQQSAVQTELSRAELTQALASGSARLAADQEKALRMLHGVAAPRTLVLERVGQNHPEAREKLLGIELELLRQSRSRATAAATTAPTAGLTAGHGRPATAPAPAAQAAPANPRRAKIVAALKSKKPTR